MTDEKVIFPAPAPFKNLLDELGQILSKFIKECSAAAKLLGRFESEVEALNLNIIAVRQIEGFLKLARHDLVLLPAGASLARCALESTLKAAWLVKPEEPFDRETRWLAHLEGEERLGKRLATEFDAMGVDGSNFLNQAGQIRSFRESVQAKMPEGVAFLKGNPSVKGMFEELDANSIYKDYMYLSQYVHGEHHATRHYRGHGLGTYKELKEAISVLDWLPPSKAIFYSLGYFGRQFLESIGGDGDAVLTASECKALDTRIGELGSASAAQIMDDE